MSKQQQYNLMEQHRGVHADLLLMCLPLVAMAVFFYGLRPALLCLTAIITANLCDRIVALLRHTAYQKREWSSEAFAVMLTLMMPASVSYYVVFVGALATVMLGKEVFGGYGAYPFHPTAVGYAVVAVNWPEQMFQYPQPFSRLPLGMVEGVALAESPLHVLKNGGIPVLDAMELLLGNYAGAMGLTALLVTLACAVFLISRRRISLLVSGGFLLGAALVAFVAPRMGFLQEGPLLMDRLQAVKYELCSGGMVFTAVYLLADPVTLPKNRVSKLLFGLLLGFMSMMFRYYGIHEVGVCFAILSVNAVSGWLDRSVRKLMSRKGVVRREF
ncbi:MAG: RnfABCDGE type electron transport complex subunit D [Candidatus Fournierella pullistercoris]|uniref:RnfABCDGE type electron transport complex subunit D n=1 Tax=Candidatus Allofournierella pullistercoris TaxID=2838597 RepID=A0A948T1F5_9FIRM|nr:RnfABCDGE type electron transport complex subunit D [Candidatus Fournierella pullistercoris]